MSLKGDRSLPTKIISGQESILEIASACKYAGIPKPLLVTDQNLASLPMVAETLGLMDSHNLGCAMFAGPGSDPNETHLATGVEAYYRGGHDGVIALGGGSVLDLGKLIALASSQTSHIQALEDLKKLKLQADDSTIPPIVAVPTTAGTGSEITPYSVITNSNTGAKNLFYNSAQLPSIAICDPELAIQLPDVITIGSGLCAFTHCLEAICFATGHQTSKDIALEGLRLAKENLPLSLTDNMNFEARAHMMSAAQMGAKTLNNGLGMIGTLSTAIEAICKTPYGVVNSIILPQALKLNRKQFEVPVTQAADYLGLSGGLDGFCDAIQLFRSELGVPEKLSEFGISPDGIEGLVTSALNNPCFQDDKFGLRREMIEQIFVESL